MLKIYIQIFGTIALVAIILVNYNIFYKTPALDQIGEKQGKVTTLQGDIARMEEILVFEPAMRPVSELVDEDFELIRLDLPATYSIPDRIKRIYDLVQACGLQYKGIPAQAVLNAQPTAKVGDFIPNVQDKKELENSIASFKSAMAPPFADQARAQAFLATESPVDRFQFYQEMAKDWKLAKGGLSRGLERHRYALQLTGSYSNIKRFLWMVQNDKPLMQATAVRIAPGIGVGESRPFNLSVTIIAYVDRHDFYQQIQQGDPAALFEGSKKSE